VASSTPAVLCTRARTACALPAPITTIAIAVSQLLESSFPSAPILQVLSILALLLLCFRDPIFAVPGRVPVFPPDLLGVFVFSVFSPPRYDLIVWVEFETSGKGHKSFESNTRQARPNASRKSQHPQLIILFFARASANSWILTKVEAPSYHGAGTTTASHAVPLLV
jgi:hypothetical protein